MFGDWLTAGRARSCYLKARYNCCAAKPGDGDEYYKAELTQTVYRNLRDFDYWCVVDNIICIQLSK